MMYEVTVNTPTMSATLRGENRDDLFALVKKIEELVAEPAPALPIIDGGPEWIDWTGGACPVRNGADVEVRFRTGGSERDDSPQFWAWDHTGDTGDIVAYRVFA